MSPKESMIQFALENLESDKILSIRAAAKLYGVPEATIRRRQHGYTSKQSSRESQQRLSK